MKEKKLKTKHNSNLLISLYRDYALGNLTIIQFVLFFFVKLRIVIISRKKERERENIDIDIDQTST